MRFKLAMNRLIQTISRHEDEVVSEVSFKIVQWLQHKADDVQNVYIKGPQNIYLVQYRNNALDDLVDIADRINDMLTTSIAGGIDRFQIDSFCNQMRNKERVDSGNNNTTIIKGVGAAGAALLSILTIILSSIPLDVDETFRWTFFAIGLAAFVGASVLSVFIVKDDKENFLGLVLALAQALLRLVQAPNMTHGMADIATQIPGSFFYNPNLLLEQANDNSIHRPDEILEQNAFDNSIHQADEILEQNANNPQLAYQV